MKNVLLLSFILIVVLAVNGCKKCFQCHNVCQSCSYSYPDTTLSILVCSEKLSEKYYLEYIDSLTSPSLGWACTGAGSNYSESFCATESNSSFTIIEKKEAGLVCGAE